MALVAALGASWSQPAAAATIRVNSFVQDDDRPHVCTLTSAIRAANGDVAVAGCSAGNGADVIELPAGTFTIMEPAVVGGGDGTAFPHITQPVTIIGDGPDRTIIERHQGSFFTFRFFHTRAGWLELAGLALVGGTVAPHYNGGAIFAEDTAVILNNVRLENNQAFGGGAIADLGLFGTQGAEITITNSAIVNNTALHAGGAIRVSAGGTVTIMGSRFTNNTSSAWGGAIYNHSGATVSITDTRFENNRSTGADGGALHVHGPSLTRATFIANEARDGGGALYSYGARPVIVESTFTGNQSRRGGAIEVHAGSIAIDRSTFAGNRAAGFDGGALRLDDRTRDSRISNSTFSANLTGTRGAIALESGALSINNSTIAFNTNANPSSGWSAGITAGFQGDTEVSIANSIVAHNSYNGTPLDALFDPASGGDRIVSLGHNIIGVDTWVSGVFTQVGDRVGTAEQPLDAGLLPLADNGGPTLTHALDSDSPALDAGSSDATGAAGACLAVDQRGKIRPGPGTASCDVGAHEHGTYYTLRVEVSGGGSVAGIPGVPACEDSCIVDLGVEAEVTLIAQPDLAFALVSWAGACSESTPTCVVTMTGTHTVTATFAPAGGESVTTLTSSPNPSAPNEPVVLTATVAPQPPAIGIPNGEVRFVDTTLPGVIGTATLDASGNAVLTLRTMPQGERVIQALYGGDDLFSASSSRPLSHRVGVLVNVAPSFAMPAFAPEIAEDAGVQLVEHFADALIVGPPSESAQGFVGFTVMPVDTIGSITFLSGPVLALDGTLTYEVAPDSNGRATFRVTLQDDGGTSDGGQDTSAPQDFTITVTAINDAPAITVPNAQSVGEDATLIFTGANRISVTDADDLDDRASGDQNIEVRLAVPSGTLTLNGTAGLMFSAGSNAAGVMTFSGTLAAINHALNGLAYQPPVNVAGPVTLTITADDLGHSGSGGPRADSDLIPISVTPANDAPVNTVPGPQSMAEDSSLVFGTTLGNRIAVYDPDDIDDGAAGDHEVQVTLAVSSGRLLLNSTAGVTFAAGNNGTALMTVAGTLSAVNNILHGLTYQPPLDFAGSATLTITANDLGHSGDGGPRTDSDVIDITVTPVNDAPLMTVPGPQSVSEDAPLILGVMTANGVSIFDVDDLDDGVPGDQIAEVTLAVSRGTLTLNTTAGLSFSAGGNSAATMTFAGTLASLNHALNGLTYVPTANFTGTATLTITASDRGHSGDGGARSDVEVLSITAAPVNDAPVNTVPGPQAAIKNVAQIFGPANANMIGVADVDDFDNQISGDALIQVALAASNGTVSLSSTSGLVFSAGSNGSGAMTVSGSINSVNAALNGLRYVPALNFVGSSTLTVTTSDLGNFGAGGALVDIDVIALDIAEPNHVPTLVTPGPQGVPVNAVLIFSGASSNPIAVADVDDAIDGVVGDMAIQMTLGVSHGRLALSTVLGLSFAFSDANGTAEGDGNADATLRFRGSLAAVNAALDGLRYSPTAGFAGADALTITVNDLGNSGAGGALAVTRAVHIEIAQPRIVISDAHSVEQDGTNSQASFAVTLSSPATETVSVTYTTANAGAPNAASASDFVAASGVLSFSPGMQSQTFTVMVVGDLIHEPSETFVVNLSAPSNATLLDPQGVGTIVDNDPQPTLAIGNDAVVEGDSSTVTAVFALKLSARSGLPATVHYATSPATAVAGSDFSGIKGSLTFLPGETAKTISVTVHGDALNEANETFSVDLLDATGAIVTAARGIGTIVNDDPLPSVSVSDVAAEEPSAGTTPFEFSVRLSMVSGQTVQVNVATTRHLYGNSDFVAATGTVVFAPGELRKTFAVLVNADAFHEIPETFTVLLTEPINAVLGDASATGTIYDANKPTLLSFSPAGGPEGTVVTIRGLNLTSATSVRFGGAQATFTAVDDTTISSIVPAQAQTSPISVTTNYGLAQTGSEFIFDRQEPLITSFSPASAGTGAAVTIRGRNFTGVTAVRIGHATATFTFVDDTTVTAIVPVGARTGPIAVVTPKGTARSTTDFVFIPVPTFRQFIPNSAPIGDTVELQGNHFIGVTSVRFNGIEAAFTVRNTERIDAIVPPGATTGPVRITAAGGTYSSNTWFYVTPRVSGFSPSGGAAGTLVTIRGSGFTSVTGLVWVRFGTADALDFTVIDDTTIQAIVPPNATVAPISVSGGSSASAFNFIPAPTVQRGSPHEGTVGTAVTLTGTNFIGVTAVHFNGASASFTVISDTEIRATVPNTATTGSIKAVGPGGTGETRHTFNVLPSISHFTPDVAAPGTPITIFGSGFSDVQRVRIGGVSAIYETVSSTQLRVIVPPHSGGKIKVTTLVGTATSDSNFRLP